MVEVEPARVVMIAPIMALPAVLLGLSAAIALPLLGYIAGAVELLIFLGGVTLWWMPYLTGVAATWATAGTGISWAELHARTYARTLIVLPPIGNRPRPNLEHMILHALVLSATISTFTATAAL